MTACAACGPEREARAHLTTCEPCERHVATQARAVAGLYPRLTVVPGSGGGATDAPRAPGYESQSPANDHAMDLMDERSSDSVMATLGPWRDAAVDDGARGALGYFRNVAGVAEFLASWDGLEWASRRPDAGALVRALDKLVGRLEAAVGDVEPTAPVGACPREVEAKDAQLQTVRRPCGGVIRALVYGGLAECRRCGAQWQGEAAWRELGRKLGDAELDAAGLARYFTVPVGTIRRWASEDGWQRRQVGRRTLFSLAEARHARDRRELAKAVEPAGGDGARHANVPPVTV